MKNKHNKYITHLNHATFSIICDKIDTKILFPNNKELKRELWETGGQKNIEH